MTGPTMGESLKRAEIASEAAHWLGTPYVPHARVRGEGVDCLMLLAEVYHACGIVERVEAGPYSTQFGMHADEETYELGLQRHGAQPLGHAAPRVGDVGTWRFGRTYSHGGIVVGESPLRVVHAWRKAGRVVVTGLDEAPLAGRPVHWWTLWAGH